MAGVSTTLVMPCHRDLPVETVKSLIETQSLFQRRGYDFGIQMCQGSSDVVAARNWAVDQFLEGPGNRLFWVDSDMVWRAEDALRLVALSTVMDCVGATYVTKSDKLNFVLQLGGEEVAANEWGCVPINGIGLGFTIVTRSIIETLAAKSERLRRTDKPNPIAWIFRRDSLNGESRGEDMAFFSDIRGLGHTVWLDPSITLGHVGSKVYAASIKDHLIPKPVQ